MARAGDQPETHRARRLVILAAWAGGAGGVVVLTLMGGVAAAALLAGQSGSDKWRMWSDVGQTFGVLSAIISSLTLSVVVVTGLLQFRDMQHNREEMRRQREFLTNNLDLRRLSHANLGLLHQRIIAMSIDDPELARVWPAFSPDLDPAINRQYLYANLIYSFQYTILRSGNLPDSEIIHQLRYLFTSPIMRGYWRAAESARSSLHPDSAEYTFGKQIDKICAEYEDVDGLGRA